MLASAIKTYFENLIDDTLDEDFTYDLMNSAKDQIETERDWEILKKKDTSLTATTANTYATEYSLPSDFFTPRKIWVGSTQYFPIPFENQIDYKDAGGYYFIDHANSKLHITGTISTSSTITIFYSSYSSDLSSASTWAFPSKFHKILAYKMADLYFAGLDTDDINYRMSPQQKIEYNILKENMVQWDTQLKLNAMDYSTMSPKIDYSKQSNTIDLID